MKRRKTDSIFNKALLIPYKQTKSNRVLRLVKPVPGSTYTPGSGNLPVSLTPIIGREAEIEAICQLVASPATRLVTLYGTAGIGKTRLGMAVGEKLQALFRDGVFFVNLAPLSKPESGLAAIAQALGLQDQRQLPLLEKLQDHLKRRSILLILDNFEQIIALAPAILELLAAASQLKVIVTSRVALRLHGETIYAVPQLPLAELADTPSFETLRKNEAVTLFSQRARMVNPDFELTGENAGTVASLCIYLEGLPLAIELAAARSDLFSPEAMLDRLGAGKRFELLAGGFSNLPVRQQTLANALEWSIQLLNNPEKQLFRRLGIFAGSFSLAAVEALSSEATFNLEVILSLLNKSLVKPVAGRPGEDLRFTMLETVREYALEKLIEESELEIARTIHSQYFIELVETGVENLQKPDHLNWLKRLEIDHSNILSALDYLIETGNVEGAFRLGGSIWAAWWRWGYLSQGRQWLNKILELGRDNVENILLAKVLDGVAYLAMYQNDYKVAENYFNQSIEIWREKRAGKKLARALSGLAGTYRILGDYDRALKLNYESLDLYRSLGKQANEADSLCNIAWQLMERGNYETVQSNLEKALAIHTRENYLSGIARTKIYLGDFLWRKNDPARAIRYLEEAVTMLRQVNHRIQLSGALHRLGVIYLCQGQMGLAERALEESVEIAEEMHKLLDLTYAYSSLGLFRLVQKDLSGAKNLFQKALNLRPEVGQLEGILWAIEGLAVLALEQADYSQAAQSMEEAQVLRKAIFAPVLPHTLKFILPVFLNHNKNFNGHQAQDQLKSRPASRVIPVEVIPAPAHSKPANLGLDEAEALSKRESEVLNLVAQGHPTSQIASLLLISPGTVNNHLNSIYSKLGVNSRTSAIRYALDHRLF